MVFNASCRLHYWPVWWLDQGFLPELTKGLVWSPSTFSIIKNCWSKYSCNFILKHVNMKQFLFHPQDFCSLNLPEERLGWLRSLSFCQLGGSKPPLVGIGRSPTSHWFPLWPLQAAGGGGGQGNVNQLCLVWSCFSFWQLKSSTFDFVFCDDQGDLLVTIVKDPKKMKR